MLYLCMESLKIDRTKLITVSNYGKSLGLTRQAIYARVRNGKLKIVEIDGIKFIEKT